MGDSVTELSRCCLCKCSYSNIRKHLYSLKHIDRLRCILTKFSQKILEARSLLENPLVKEGLTVDEGHANFWCYFCSNEFPRHLVFDGQFFLNDAGILDHISSAQHRHMTNSFWRDNRIHSKNLANKQSSNNVCQQEASAEVRNNCGSIMGDYYKSDVQKKLRADVGTHRWKDWLANQNKTKKSESVAQSLTNGDLHSPETGSVTPSQKLESKNCVEFDKNLFLLSIDDFQRYREKSKCSIAEHFCRLDAKLNKEVCQIMVTGEKRRRLVEYFQQQTVGCTPVSELLQLRMMQTRSDSAQLETEDQPGRVHPGKRSAALSRPGSLTPAAVRTIAAHGEGLTCIKVPKIDKSIGNVHSGAPPPWLKSETVRGSETVETSVIGPTSEDLEKHMARQCKLKLPATRVGADFDHQRAPASNWVPSFGRVWSKNRRTHQQDHFIRKELHKFKGTDKTPGHVTAMMNQDFTRNASCSSQNLEFQTLSSGMMKSSSQTSLDTGLGRTSSTLVSSRVPSAGHSSVGLPNAGKYQRKRGFNSRTDDGGMRLNISTNLL